MPRICTVCAHTDRPAIDQALVGGNAFRELSALYRVSEDSLVRHKARHLPAALREARQAEDVRHAIDILEQLKEINAASLKVLQDAREHGNHVLQLRAVDRVYKQIQLQARLIGELDERPQIHVLLAPEWLAVRAALLAALLPYPEARHAVAARLLEMEAPREHSG